ncbi:hypothetical protein [Thermomonospora amylolytica]|uniref:hypothetical protein n=1 Tax=Thermomonospora amylolytica TaxID=1411117 RepID=UPI0013008890|nr:hypothetical protein [Thermomonospora amylolytica]
MNKAQLAIAVGAGYLLGRTRKLRWALTLAGAGASRRLPGNVKGLTAQGVQLLGSSPEAKALTQTVRGRLTEAGRAAVMAAASSRIDDLSDRLHKRTDLLLAEIEPEEDEGEGGRREEESQDRKGRKGRKGRKDQEDREEHAEEPEKSEEPAEETRASKTRSPRRRRDTAKDAAKETAKVTAKVTAKDAAKETAKVTAKDAAKETAKDAAEAVSDRPARARRAAGGTAERVVGRRTRR